MPTLALAGVLAGEVAVVRRLPCKQEVVGSIPTFGSTKMQMHTLWAPPLTTGTKSRLATRERLVTDRRDDHFQTSVEGNELHPFWPFSDLRKDAHRARQKRVDKEYGHLIQCGSANRCAVIVCAPLMMTDF